MTRTRERPALIPGDDPEIEVHGDLPPVAEPAEVTRLSCIDLRDDRERFADLANPLIDTFPERLASTWYRFESIACSVPDALVHNRLIFHRGLPVLGISNLRWESTTAEVSARGELQIPEPEQHFKGRTGFLVGRSSFNYYHYMADTLIFMEDLHALVNRLGLDRIVINPCIGDDDGFQRKLLRQIYPEIADKVVFSIGPFSAEHLTFVCIWPGLFQHGAGEEAVIRKGPKGVARRAYRRAARPFFDRAERALGARDFADRNRVILISRKEAIRRKVVNEDDLVEALKPLGVEPVIMERLSVPEQMDLMASARAVIGPHGAGMINTGFCQAGATCIELQARHYMQRALMFATVGIVRDVSYQLVVGDEVGDIVHMKGNEGNDIRLSSRAINHITEAVATAVAAKTPDEAAGL